MSGDGFQERATRTIRPLIPPDAEERVSRAVKQWNQVSREQIRNETGLKLSDRENRDAIPVRVDGGFPASLAQLIDQHDDPVLWMLLMGQPKIGGLIEGLELLLPVWDQFEGWPLLPDAARDGRPFLERSREIASVLQGVALMRRVQDEICGIEEDILGSYMFSARGSSIAIYWMPIAMVAAMKNVRIEDLAVVVLLHELTHGYTHLGRDIDGGQWESAGFGLSSRSVTEGLAQFYTAVVAEKLASRSAGVLRAYQGLLELQSGAYRAHLDWLKGDARQRGETVRFSMIAARRQGTISYAAWVKIMEGTGDSLRRPGLARVASSPDKSGYERDGSESDD